MRNYMSFNASVSAWLFHSGSIGNEVWAVLNLCQGLPRMSTPAPLGLAIRSPGTSGLAESVMNVKKKMLKPWHCFHYKLSTRCGAMCSAPKPQGSSAHPQQKILNINSPVSESAVLTSLPCCPLPWNLILYMGLTVQWKNPCKINANSLNIMLPLEFLQSAAVLPASLCHPHPVPSHSQSTNAWSICGEAVPWLGKWGGLPWASTPLLPPSLSGSADLHSPLPREAAELLECGVLSQTKLQLIWISIFD